jgi:glycosyltransferase involved in cell wall biosynthesis
MKRLLISTEPIGGTWRSTMELVREFDRHGLEVVLATIGPRLTDEQRHETRELQHVTLCERGCRVPADWTAEAWDDVDETGQWLLDLARRYEPDLVQMTSLFHGALPWRVPSVIVPHSCEIGRWEAVHGTTPPASLDAYRRRVRDSLTAADLIITPTGAMLDQLEKVYGRLPHAQVVWHSRRHDAFHCGPKVPMVFGSGRVWDPAKNLAALDRAAGHLSWPAAISGEVCGPHGEVVTLANAQWMGVLTPQDQASRLSSARVFCLPARYEPSGIGITEAALSGCALVLGDLPSMKELWSDAALFVPPGDDAAVASTLEWLSEHPVECDRLANQAHAVAEAWTPAAMAGTYLARYRSTCAALVA